MPRAGYCNIVGIQAKIPIMIHTILSFLSKFKLVHYIALALIVISIFCVLLLRTVSNLKRTVQRQDANVATLYGSLNDERTASGKLMSQVGILRLEKHQIKEFYEKEVIKSLEDMRVKLRRLESFSATSIESEHIIVTTLRDSVRLVDSRLEPIKYIDYKSEFLDFYQIQAGNEVRTVVRKRDSLIQVVWQPFKEGFFLARPFKRKPPLEQKITSADPNSVIKYNLYIKPVKKRRNR